MPGGETDTTKKKKKKKKKTTKEKRHLKGDEPTSREKKLREIAHERLHTNGQTREKSLTALIRFPQSPPPPPPSSSHNHYLCAEGPVPGQVLLVVGEAHPCNGLERVPPRQLPVRRGRQVVACKQVHSTHAHTVHMYKYISTREVNRRR